MHDVFARLFDGRLIFPPISRPRRVLDCGFGSANWAMEVAALYPSCEVRVSRQLPRLWFPPETGQFRAGCCRRQLLATAARADALSRTCETLPQRQTTQDDSPPCLALLGSSADGVVDR